MCTPHENEIMVSIGSHFFYGSFELLSNLCSQLCVHVCVCACVCVCVYVCVCLCVEGIIMLVCMFAVAIFSNLLV